MNLRPPGYEPGELPDCSTPRRGPDCSTLVTFIPMWDWAIWAALLIGGAAATGALTIVAVRARHAWLAFKGVRRELVAHLEELAAMGEVTAEKVEAAGDTAELQESLLRLRLSLARLAVLRAAIDEAQDTFGRITAVVPRG